MGSFICTRACRHCAWQLFHYHNHRWLHWSDGLTTTSTNTPLIYSWSFQIFRFKKKTVLAGCVFISISTYLPKWGGGGGWHFRKYQSWKLRHGLVQISGFYTRHGLHFLKERRSRTHLFWSFALCIMHYYYVFMRFSLQQKCVGALLPDILASAAGYKPFFSPHLVVVWKICCTLPAQHWMAARQSLWQVCEQSQTSARQRAR